MNEHPQKASNIDINSMYIMNKPASIVNPKVTQKKVDRWRYALIALSVIANLIVLSQNSIYYILTIRDMRDVEFGLQLFYFDAIILRFQHFVAFMYVQYVYNYEYNQLSILTTILALMELIETLFVLLLYAIVYYAFNVERLMNFSYVLAALGSGLYTAIFWMSIVCKKDARACGISMVAFFTTIGVSIMWPEAGYFFSYALVYTVAAILLYMYSYLNNERLFRFSLGKVIKQFKTFCWLFLPTFVVGFNGFLNNLQFLALVIYEVKFSQKDEETVLYTSWVQVVGRQLQITAIFIALIRLGRMTRINLLLLLLAGLVSSCLMCYFVILVAQRQFTIQDYYQYVLDSFGMLFVGVFNSAFLCVIIRYRVYGIQSLVGLFDLLIVLMILAIATTLTVDDTFHDSWVFMTGYASCIIGFGGFFNVFLQQFHKGAEDE